MLLATHFDDEIIPYLDEEVRRFEHELARFRNQGLSERVRGARVPARSVPAFLRDILTFYRDSRRAEEGFNAFAGRIGPDAFVQLARPYQDTSPDAIERLRVNRDWDRQTSYKLERGEGECSA